jgi:aminoglycoside phosphotransferase (APT) family kinase protein
MTLEATELLPTAELEAYLDAQGLGSGTPRAMRIGDGASNLTYLVERDGARVVLRRPPPPPLPPSAHDMVREANIQICLRRGGVRVPEILAVCDDDAVIGAPFYVMEEIVGAVITDAVPPALDTPEERRRLGFELVDGLVDLHAVDYNSCGLDRLGKPTGYLERQLRRWSGLWEVNATREIADCLEVGELLKASMPESPPSTVVHGDYRLGNLMVKHDRPARVLAVLDWEMGAIGDPRADVGYLLATYSEAGAASPLGTSPVTTSTGFPSRAELVERYEERSGRRVEALGWFQALALWKAAVFCEAIYGRFIRGELSAEDTGAARFERGVPLLAETALTLIG